MATTYQIVDARQVYLDVKAYFTANNVPAGVFFGWTEVTKQNNQGPAPNRAGRVVFVPGDDSGKAGTYTGAVQLGGRRRHLLNKQELFEVRIWGHDASAPTDEAAQYAATRVLEDWTLVALADAANGRFKLSDPVWTVNPKEKLFGRELTIQVTLDVPVLRVPAPGDAGTQAEPEYTVSLNDTLVCPHS